MSNDPRETTKDVVSFNEPRASVLGLIELDDDALATVVGGATCTDNEGSCSTLTGCNVNTGSCTLLATCEYNDCEEK